MSTENNFSSPNLGQDNNVAEKRESKLLAVALVSVVVATIVIAIVGFLFLKRPADIVQGQADATSVTVSGKLPGRVADFYVKEGDMVKAGDTLVHIHSSVVEAKLKQAQAMKDAAAASNKVVDAGARQQTIQSARDLVKQAQAATTITRKTYERMENLAKQGVVSLQKRDEAKAAYDAATAAEDAARSQLSLAESGARPEEKVASASMVNVAQGGVAEVDAILQDQYLLAPCDGQVDQIYPQVGELVSVGTPIMSVLKLQDKWITFNVREENLNNLKLGQEITVKIPALDMKEVKAKIYYVRDMGSYATWRATKATGDWDSKTFEIKAHPTQNIPDLRPGMSILYYLK